MGSDSNFNKVLVYSKNQLLDVKKIGNSLKNNITYKKKCSLKLNKFSTD